MKRGKAASSKETPNRLQEIANIPQQALGLAGIRWDPYKKGTSSWRSQPFRRRSWPALKLREFTGIHWGPLGFAGIRWDSMGIHGDSLESALEFNIPPKDLRFLTEDAALPRGCEFAWDLMGSTADSRGFQCH